MQPARGIACPEPEKADRKPMKNNGLAIAGLRQKCRDAQIFVVFS